jgi:hypothetical protein
MVRALVINVRGAPAAKRLATVFLGQRFCPGGDRLPRNRRGALSSRVRTRYDLLRVSFGVTFGFAR